MSTQSELKIGDIVTIKKSPVHLLIVRSERQVDRDDLRGDSYWVDEIDCIEIANDRWGKPQSTIQYDAPKLKHFYFEGGGGKKGRGKAIKDTDVLVVGTSKLTTYTTITHVMDHVKYYDNK